MSSRVVLSGPQQYILQIFMNRGVIDQFDFKYVFINSFKQFDPKLAELEQIPKEIYSKFIMEINDAIKPYNMEIQKGVCEVTGITFYCFVRLFDTASIGKMSALYNSSELKVFNIVLELIMESDHGFVDYTNIVNQVYDSFQEMSETAATQSQTVKLPTNREIRTIVEKFIKDYWLMEIVNQPNRITLHGRALIELSQYIGELYDADTLNFCTRCKKLLILGIKCENCPSMYHRGCAKEIFSTHKDCISCKKAIDKEKINELIKSISASKDAYAAKYSRD